MKEQIRELFLSNGADLCGFAGIERFSNAPLGFSPVDIYPECKSVIAFAVALPQGLAKVGQRMIYGYYNYFSCPEVDLIAFKSAKKMEGLFGCIAVPLPCDGPYEYWDEEKREGRGLLSLKHAAVEAGLGSLGKNTLFISKRYGNMLTLGAVLTNLVLPSDTIAESICIVKCNACIEACPVKAIDNGLVNQKLCRENTYGKTKRGFNTVDCNKCRTACPANSVGSRTDMVSHCINK
jgi:epoxyqueuosine reductase QueG